MLARASEVVVAEAVAEHLGLYLRERSASAGSRSSGKNLVDPLGVEDAHAPGLQFFRTSRLDRVNDVLRDMPELQSELAKKDFGIGGKPAARFPARFPTRFGLCAEGLCGGHVCLLGAWSELVGGLFDVGGVGFTLFCGTTGYHMPFAPRGIRGPKRRRDTEGQERTRIPSGNRPLRPQTETDRTRASGLRRRTHPTRTACR